MVVKVVREIWVASDGTEFPDKGDAERHEAVQDVVNVLMPRLPRMTSAMVEAVVDALMDAGYVVKQKGTQP